MSTSSESDHTDPASPAVARRERPLRGGDGRRSAFPLFVVLSVVSLAAYLAVSPAVRGFLERASALLDTLARVVA